MRDNPELKGLEENVLKSRRTQNGELLFELKKDPSVKSVAFKELVERVLGDEASVRALSQETTIECRELSMFTMETDLRQRLESEDALGKVPMKIHLRKAYRGTQTATIRLPTDAANKLLKLGRINVCWAVGRFRTIPRVPKELVVCYKCLDFGHQARNCLGPDRSKLCRKCGQEGHFASDCQRQPRCMLCKKEDGNVHMTGGYNCPVFKKAKAGQQ